ncbi:MAG: glycoside hydrolase family 76 protein [Mucilaginibacter sp.]
MMKKTHFFSAASALLLAAAVCSCKKDALHKPLPTTSQKLPANRSAAFNSSSAYYSKAQDTHAFVVGNILTSYNSYRVNLTTNSCYEWYNVSQIYADAAMIQAGDTRYNAYMNNSYSWMSHMWDSGSSIGGYFSSANTDGSGAGGDKYVDDNSLTGLAYLDAYAVTTGTTQTNYLNSAKAVANWLMNNGLWDSTYGGGFWWHSGTHDLKPTQTNGLAMQLFLKLYQVTGQSYYLSWANSVRAWLEGNMYDSTTGLYIWKIDGAGSGTKHTEKFTYDNAIMLEADLLYASIASAPAYVTKAQNLGIAMNTNLWNSTYHVYIFNTTDGRINPAWCVWGSQAMIRLYEADGNAAWLDYAQQNIDYMNSKLRNNTNYGYYTFCNFDGSGIDTRMEGVDQAWMQRTQILLSNYR